LQELPYIAKYFPQNAVYKQQLYNKSAVYRQHFCLFFNHVHQLQTQSNFKIHASIFFNLQLSIAKLSTLNVERSLEPCTILNLQLSAANF
jgi:hypothetical protein